MFHPIIALAKGVAFPNPSRGNNSSQHEPLTKVGESFVYNVPDFTNVTDIVAIVLPLSFQKTSKLKKLLIVFSQCFLKAMVFVHHRGLFSLLADMEKGICHQR